MNKVIVIGGGAAGLMAALSAAEAGASVLLLEGNEKLGKKIYITGKGRCNVTNACEPAAFMNKVVKNPRFLFSALNAFGPEDMMALLERLGCPVKVERGDRVFPVSEKASDVHIERYQQRVRIRLRVDGDLYDLHHYQLTPAELALMRAIKAAMDPAHILNPGKMLPA